MNVSAVETWVCLIRVAAKVSHGTEAYFQRLGLSHSRFMILMILMRSEGQAVSPAQIAQLIQVSRPTITGLLDTLAGDGLIERVPDPEDRRCLGIVLTEAGRAKLDQLLPGHYTRMAEALSHVSEEERKTFVQILLKVAKGLEVFEAFNASPPVPTPNETDTNAPS